MRGFHTEYKDINRTSNMASIDLSENTKTIFIHWNIKWNVFVGRQVECLFSVLSNLFLSYPSQALADLGAACPAHAPLPLRVQILSFWHTKFSKCTRLGSPRPPPPPPREILDPPLTSIYLSSSQQCPCQTNQLSLSDTVVKCTVRIQEQIQHMSKITF